MGSKAAMFGDAGAGKTVPAMEPIHVMAATYQGTAVFAGTRRRCAAGCLHARLRVPRRVPGPVRDSAGGDA